jgi:HEPN domain-containing protein
MAVPSATGLTLVLAFVYKTLVVFLFRRSSELWAMNQEEITRYYLYSSDADFQAMDTLFGKGHHVWALVAARIAIEKLLRACCILAGVEDLEQDLELKKLALMAHLEIGDEYQSLLDEMDSFRVNPSDPQAESLLYRKANRRFTEGYINKVVELRQRLVRHIKG